MKRRIRRLHEMRSKWGDCAWRPSDGAGFPDAFVTPDPCEELEPDFIEYENDVRADFTEHIKKAYAASLVTAKETDEEHALARALGAAYLAGRRSHPSGSQDVDDLAAFFHEESWGATGEPHLSREQAVSTDCESCWGSADRLVARLSRNEEARSSIHEQEHWPHMDGSGRWCKACSPRLSRNEEADR